MAWPVDGDIKRHVMESTPDCRAFVYQQASEDAVPCRGADTRLIAEPGHKIHPQLTVPGEVGYG
jgi:hypothetical protein